MQSKTSPEDQPKTPSVDQRAIDDYFASDLYASGRSSRLSHPIRAWMLDTLVPIESHQSPAASYWMGLIGLNVLLVITAIAFPISLELFEDVFVSSTFLTATPVFLTMICPPIISFSFATVVPMFWYGSVIARFASGVLAVTPGCIAFIVSLSVFVDGNPPSDFLFGFVTVMITQFITAGVIAVTIQMWSPWTLTHARAPGQPLPPLGTRAMMELTGVAAVGCAIVFAYDVADLWQGILFFAGVGLFSSLAVIGVLIAFLREERLRWLSAGIAVFFAYATAFLFCAFFAAAQFGYDAIFYNVLLIGAVAIYGAVVICAMMWICLWWLRSCGWRCVSREDEKRIKPASEQS